MIIYSKLAGLVTVADLIRVLQDLPPDAIMMHEGGEHKDDFRHIRSVDYEPGGYFGRPAHSVVLS